MSEMPEETRTALRESIAHWKHKYEVWKRSGLVPHMNRNNCPLCQRFKNFPDECEHDVHELCPAAKGSSGGQKYCRGTPFTGAPDSHAEFADEIAYLESLLEGTK